MKLGKVRPLAICVFRRGDRILAAEGYDLVKGETFYRPLGGRIEFGEYSHETVALQYNKWIYGDEVPINFRAPPSEKLDTDALSLGFGMWW